MPFGDSSKKPPVHHQQDRRRERPVDDSDQNGSHQQHSTFFSNLPVITQARFSDAQQHTIIVPLEVPASQLGQQATLNILSQKLLFQPADSFIAPPPSKNETNENKKDDDNDDDDDQQEQSPIVTRFSQQQSPSSKTSTKKFPVRIITSIEEISDVKPLGTKPSARGGELFMLAVSAKVQSVNILSEGFSSAMVCRPSSSTHHHKKKKGATEITNNGSNEEDQNEKESVGLKVSFMMAKDHRTSSAAKNKKKTAKDDSDDDDDDDDEQQQHHAPQFFTCKVPLDAAHLLGASALDTTKLAGKKILVSVDHGGTAWRAHLGLTPGSGGKGQNNGHWETHMPWHKDEKRTQWNFRAPPPSQRSNDERIVVKFVKDSIAPKS